LLWLALAGGRVLTGSHFVSDVLAGGAVGVAVMVGFAGFVAAARRGRERASGGDAASHGEKVEG
jgi:membrane-associated phospholipid phosphatase